MSLFWDHAATMEILTFKHHRESIEEIDKLINKIRWDYDVYPCCYMDAAKGGMAWASINVEEFAIRKVDAEFKLLARERTS